MSTEKFRGIEDTLNKWVIVYLINWPEELRNSVTGLCDVEGRWLQFKLKGVDNFGIWIENPHFNVSLSDVTKDDETIKEQQQALLNAKAYVLIKWQYVSTIVYLDGQDEPIPLGFTNQFKNQ